MSTQIHLKNFKSTFLQTFTFRKNLGCYTQDVAFPPTPHRHSDKTEKLASPHLQVTPNIPSPPPTTHPEKIEKLAFPHPQETH
jgi:hypothetical protein